MKCRTTVPTMIITHDEERGLIIGNSANWGLGGDGGGCGQCEMGNVRRGG